jgi:hypothetical protein
MNSVKGTWRSLKVGDLFRIGSMNQFDQQSSNTSSFVVTRIGSDGSVYYNIAADDGAYPPEMEKILRDGDGPAIIVERGWRCTRAS